MDDIQIFTRALNIQHPWHIKEISYKEGETSSELHIYLSHDRGIKFAYEEDLYPVYDHQSRVWRHLNFFEHHCYLHAEVPRVKTKENKVRLVSVPWAEPGSSFTLLFESYAMELVKNGMCASKAGESLAISGKRVFRIINRKVSQALISQPLKPVKELSLDETSSKRGHNYLTVLCDRAAKKVVGISEGKDKQAVGKALVDMEIRGADKESVKVVTMDMSRSYIAAASEYFQQADIVFDRFHIMKKMNEAVDQIRKTEHLKCRDDFKRTKYLWLKNSDKLKEDQKQRVEDLSNKYPNIGEAYRLKELLKQVLDQAYEDHRLKWINQWIKEALKVNLEPINKFVNMLHNHWYGIKTYFKRLATNAYAERVNLKIQEIKRVAKGYRNINNFISMIYFHLGGLKFDKPTKYG